MNFAKGCRYSLRFLILFWVGVVIALIIYLKGCS